MSMEPETSREGSLEERALRWFVRLRADDATSAERRQLDAWLKADARHRAAYAAIEHLWAGFNEFAGDPAVARRVRNADKAARAAGERAGRDRYRRRLTAATAAAAAVLVVVFGWMRPSPHPAPVVYATGIAEHRHLVLPDGTEVDLDADSEMRVAFDRDRRSLQLRRGRAYFQVAPEHRPLRVATASGSVQAVGTAFEVDNRPGQVDVRLIEGRVLLLPGPEREPAGALPMEAGHVAHMSAGSGAPEIESLAQPGPPAWLSGRLVFDDRALAEVVAEFNRYSARPIEFDPKLAGVRVSGVFRSNDPHAFLGALRDLYGLRLVETGGGTRIVSARPGS